MSNRKKLVEDYYVETINKFLPTIAENFSNNNNKLNGLEKLKEIALSEGIKINFWKNENSLTISIFCVQTHTSSELYLEFNSILTGEINTFYYSESELFSEEVKKILSSFEDNFFYWTVNDDGKENYLNWLDLSFIVWKDFSFYGEHFDEDSKEVDSNLLKNWPNLEPQNQFSFNKITNGEWQMTVNGYPEVSYSIKRTKKATF